MEFRSETSEALHYAPLLVSCFSCFTPISRASKDENDLVLFKASSTIHIRIFFFSCSNIHLNISSGIQERKAHYWAEACFRSSHPPTREWGSRQVVLLVGQFAREKVADWVPSETCFWYHLRSNLIGRSNCALYLLSCLILYC